VWPYTSSLSGWSCSSIRPETPCRLDHCPDRTPTSGCRIRLRTLKPGTGYLQLKSSQSSG
jgi:hypothetical protein